MNTDEQLNLTTPITTVSDLLYAHFDANVTPESTVAILVIGTRGIERNIVELALHQEKIRWRNGRNKKPEIWLRKVIDLYIS